MVQCDDVIDDNTKPNGTMKTTEIKQSIIRNVGISLEKSTW